MLELDSPAVRALRRAIAEVKQCRSVNGWVTKNLLSQTPPCFGRHVKPLVLAAIVSTPVSRRFDIRQAAGRKVNC
jgi:hypothetical protein